MKKYLLSAILLTSVCALAWLNRFDLRGFYYQALQRFYYRNTGIQVEWEREGNCRFRCALPVGYNPTKTYPLAICFHGNSADENLFSPAAKNVNGAMLADSLLQAGFVVLSASARPYVSTWGNQSGLNAYVAAYKWAKQRYKLGPVSLVGFSMGGLEAILIAASRSIPNVRAMVLNVPVCNLEACYRNPLFTTTIDRAYEDHSRGITQNNPMRLPINSFRLPIFLVAATEDNEVDYQQNAAAFVRRFGRHTLIQFRSHRGGHGASIQKFIPSIMAFIRGYAR